MENNEDQTRVCENTKNLNILRPSSGVFASEKDNEKDLINRPLTNVYLRVSFFTEKQNLNALRGRIFWILNSAIRYCIKIIFVAIR